MVIKEPSFPPECIYHGNYSVTRGYDKFYENTKSNGLNSCDDVNQKKKKIVMYSRMSRVGCCCGSARLRRRRRRRYPAAAIPSDGRAMRDYQLAAQNRYGRRHGVVADNGERRRYAGDGARILSG